MRLLPLDILFSEFIRRRAIKRVHGCERCLTYKDDYKQLQCSHFYGRSKRSVRWDEQNAAGLCAGCHMYFEANPQVHVEWFKAYIGEKEFDLLQARMRQTYPKPDQKLLALYYREKIKELENIQEVVEGRTK